LNFPDAFSFGTFADGDVLGVGLAVPVGVLEADGAGVAELGAGRGATVLVGCPDLVTGVTRAFAQTASARTATAPSAITAQSRGPSLVAASLATAKALDRTARTSRGFVCWLTPTH
jgi:hypothetical protein